MNLRPLKRKANEIGGVLAAVLSAEDDEMSRD